MRKSNIIVIAILVLLSIEFLWLWNYLKFSLIDPVDLIITIVWWLVIIAAVVAIIVVEKRRRERIRSVFVSDGVLYNCETGIIRLGDARDAKDYVKMIRHALNSLDYGAEAKLNQDQRAPALQVHRALEAVCRWRTHLDWRARQREKPAGEQVVLKYAGTHTDFRCPRPIVQALPQKPPIPCLVRTHTVDKPQFTQLFERAPNRALAHSQ